MKRDQINRAILPFRAAGIEVDIVQMGPIALYNFIAYRPAQGESGSQGRLGRPARHRRRPHRPDHHRRHRIWQRNVPIGGNHFTRALTKELKLTFAKAEHLKRNATKAPDPKADLHRDARGLQRLRQRGEPLDRVLLEREPDVEDRQGDRPGQRVQAAGPPEVPPAEPQRARTSRSSTDVRAKLVGDEVKNAAAVPPRTCRRSPSPTAWPCRGWAAARCGRTCCRRRSSRSG